MVKTLKEVLKKNLASAAVWAVLTAVYAIVSLLYKIPSEPVIYSAVLGLFLILIFSVFQFIKEKRKEAERAVLVRSVLTLWRDLPTPSSAEERDYQEMVLTLGEKLMKATKEYESEKQEALDYFVAWVHQIKTPIAVMKMKTAEDTEENRALRAELFRIEQYADMVLQYIRLGSESNDLVIACYPLDGIIKDSVHKFAPQFIEKKLKLEYKSTSAQAVTDRKWLSCILDQFLSNAVKYTPSGTITIEADEKSLSVSDTGIGIAEEDLPRIFEKGFTGRNGRMGQASSGLGLYLAKKAADMLSVSLSVQSRAGKGSTFIIGFGKD